MLLRKITMNRWHRGDPLYDKPEEVGLDTISRDLKSTDNMLSFWSFDNDEGFEDVVVAFASTMERINRLHFLLVEEQAGSLEVTKCDLKLGWSQISSVRLYGTGKC